MKVTIFGATGRTGRHLTRIALEAGHEVTAFARDAKKLSADCDKLRVVTGNLFAVEEVEQAVKGSDAVLYSVGCVSIREKDTVARGTETVVKAMERHGVKRIVVMSTVGAGDSGKALKPILRTILKIVIRNQLRDHTMQEDILKKSSLDWTAVRAAGLTDGPAKGTYKIGYDLMATRIAREDVAACMVGMLSDEKYSRKTPIITD